MKKIAFTICAKNYIGLAQVLEKSIKKFNPDVDFFIIVADRFENPDADLPHNLIIASDALEIPQKMWDEMAFKYDLTEFCTSIKPACFKFLFEKIGAEQCIYFDPDILVFSSLNGIYDKLDDFSIVVTPHITTMESNYTGVLQENGLLFTGQFNLGFLALKRNHDSKKLLDWWHNRLIDRCYINRMENYFTDQKWMDFLPSLFSETLHISKNLGLNFAPWNFYEREIISSEEEFYVKNRLIETERVDKLVFVHFSGFNYNNLTEGKIDQGNIDNFDVPVDIGKLMLSYGEKLLASDFHKYKNLTYSYNYFTNGISISKTYRKIYRRLVEDNLSVSNPFDSNSEFYKKLTKSGVLIKGIETSDKLVAKNIGGIDRKLTYLNKIFFVAFKLLGAVRFFQMVRLLRLYSKIENHAYLLSKAHLNGSKIRD